jgi:hypothetical protein
MQKERGAPFSCSSEWNKVLQSAFKKHSAAKIACNALRSSYVTHVMEESGESKRNEEEMDELATSMRHSRREQKQTYDRRKSSAKIFRAVEQSAKETAAALGLSTGGSSSSSSSSSRAGGVDVVEEYYPETGDIVALVEGDSRESDPRILLGKVLRVYRKEEEVLLAHLQASGKGTYRLTVGRDAWKESINSLVHPVDVVFDSKSGVYKLRTPVIDIHREVMKRNGCSKEQEMSA